MGDNKKIIYTVIVAIVFFMLAVPLYNTWKKDRESVTYTRTLMGTIVQITLMEGDRAAFDRAAEAAFAEIKRQEGLFSSYIPDSDVSRIAASAGETPVEVSPEVITVLKYAVRVAEDSGGAFDPTVGALGKVWGYSGEKKYVPTREEMEKALPFVDYRQIIIDEENNRAGLEKKGMTLNLGGIAKGYIVNRAVDILKEKGVTRGLIHAGGDMTVFQKDAGGKPFVIGIQHPREKKLLGEAYVVNGAVSTSGDYERYFEKDGVRYHHILDPKTGFPANLSRSVTIVSKDPTIADGLSTAVFVLGPEKGMALMEKEGVEGVIVDAQGKVIMSKGFKGKILD